MEVIIKPGENPAWRIIRNTIANKPFNNKNKLTAYQYESYNKVEFDLSRIPKEMRDKKIFKPVKLFINRSFMAFTQLTQGLKKSVLSL